jgi:glutamate racemase
MTGFFDSGVGGLSILKSFLERNPGIDVIYFADNQNGMIGSKSPEYIINSVKFAIEYLASKSCTDIYLACNTASVTIINNSDFQIWLQSNFPLVNVKNVVDPTLGFFKDIDISKKITILATPTTIFSKVYKNRLEKLGFADVIDLPSSDLARAVEDLDYQKVQQIIHGLFLEDYESIQNTDFMVLACTHYNWVKRTINEVFEKMFDYEPEIVSQSKICFEGVVEALSKFEVSEMDNKTCLSNQKNKIFITTTDSNPVEFAKKAKKLLNQ